MTTRRTFLISSVAAAAVLATGVSALAGEPKVFQSDGVAINGHDPVAYFTEGKPVEGKSAFSSQHDGATFRFASAENKALFDGNPAKYAPQYGGYCAYAVSRGYTATTDPRAWSVYEGKLYLNYSRSVRALWSTNKSGNVKAGDANWPDVLG